MSSVDGARSLYAVSDEIFTIMCDPCNYSRKHKEATHFCDECKELLCMSCMESHKGQKISRNHKILSATAVSHQGVAKQTTPCSVICECSQNVGVVSYCEDHDDVTCQTCETIKHRKCKTIPLSDKSQSYNMTNLESVFQSATKMKAETDEFLKERNIDLQKLNSMTEECKKVIKSFRKELNKHFDVLEQAILKEMEQRESQIKQEIESYISSCSTTKQMIEKDLKLLDDVRKQSKKTDMLAADVKISSRLKEYKLLLQEFVEDQKMISLTFKRNEWLTTTHLGDLSVDFVKSNKPKTTFAHLKVESSYQVELKLPDETQDSSITGCTFMPDGQLVLCDYYNKKIKTLNSSFSLRGYLKLPVSPHDVSPINNSNAIITLPHSKQLQYIEVIPSLRTGKAIKLDKSCWGVEVVGEEIYVTCFNSPGQGEVRCLDMSGKLKRRIGMKQDGSFMFSEPLYLAVNKGLQKIYVSDYNSNTVTCLLSDDSVVYVYSDPNLNSPLGIHIDDEDNIIVCGQKSNNVHIVAASGKKAGYLLTSEHGLKALRSLIYRHTDNSLIVSCLSKNKLFVYKMA